MGKTDPAKHRKEGNKFHDSIAKLLHDSGFKILKSTYTEAGPDLIVGYKNIKLIVQCKYSSEEDKLFHSIMRLIDEYSRKCEKYHADCAILAISGYRVPDKILNERDKILKRDKVSIWDDKVIDHYGELVKRIHKFSVFQILGDLNIDKKFGDDETFESIGIKQGKFEFYSVALPVNFLLSNSYVIRRVFKKEAYQRLLNKKRVVEEIPEFITKDTYVFPNSIILVSKYPLKLENHKLSLKNNYASLWVVDGQHRLYSFCNVKDTSLMNQPLLCTIFDGTKLSRAQEGKIFVDINMNAKSVSKSLIYELYGLLGINDRRVSVTNRLRETRLFHNVIKTYSENRGSVSFTTFCSNQGMENLNSDSGMLLKHLYKKYGKKKDIYDVKSEDLLFNTLYDYFSLIKKVFPNEWNNHSRFIFKTDKGVRSLMRLLDYFLVYNKGKWNETLFKEMIKRLKNRPDLIENKYLTGLYAGEAGAGLLAKEWVKEIKKAYPKFAPDVDTSEAAEKQIDSIEVHKGDTELVKRFIFEKFKLFNENVYGYLMFIDKTTFDYLKEIPKENSSIKLIIGELKEEDKCIEALSKMRAEGWKIDIYRTKRKDELGGGKTFHQRWIGTKKYRLALEQDLKKDSIAKGSHLVILYENIGESNFIQMFKQNWKFLQDHEGAEIKRY